MVGRCCDCAIALSRAAVYPAHQRHTLPVWPSSAPVWLLGRPAAQNLPVAPPMPNRGRHSVQKEGSSPSQAMHRSPCSVVTLHGTHAPLLDRPLPGQHCRHLLPSGAQRWHRGASAVSSSSLHFALASAAETDATAAWRCRPGGRLEDCGEGESLECTALVLCGMAAEQQQGGGSGGDSGGDGAPAAGGAAGTLTCSC